jgi:hypothetical protein
VLSPWTQDPITVATVVIAVATVVNVFVSAGLFVATYLTARTAKQVFEAANRPYLGRDRLRPEVDQAKKELTVTAIVRNFGSAPAEEALVDWEILFNGVPQEIPQVVAEPSTIFPSGTVRKHGTIPEPLFSHIMGGRVTLQIVIRVSYKGPGNKHYTYSEKTQYGPSENMFMMLGALKDKQPEGKR